MCACLSRGTAEMHGLLVAKFRWTETASLENGKTMDGVAREVENLAPCVVCTRIRALLIGCLI
jgi:hypothetical protein